MLIDDYINLVIQTNKKVYLKDNLLISDNFDTTKLLLLCDYKIPKSRLITAWEIIISSVEEKFANKRNVSFFPVDVLNFLFKNQRIYVIVKIYESRCKYGEMEKV